MDCEVRHVFSEWKEEWTKFRTSRFFPYVRTVARTALIYLIYAIMVTSTLNILESSFDRYAADYFDVGAELILLGLKLALSFLILNTLLLTFSMYSRSERLAFLAEKPREYDKKAERRKLIRSPYFFVETIALIVFLCVLPCSNNVESLFVLWLGANAPHAFSIRLIQGALFAVPAFLINVFGHMDARAYWMELPERLAKSSIWKSMQYKKQKAYSYSRMALRLALYFGIYLLAAKLIPLILVMFASVLVLMIFLLASAGALAIIGALFSANYLTAILRRRRFFKKLKRLCEREGHEILEVKHPYLSVFRETDGYTFALSANGQIYYARVISCINRGNYMVFDENGIFTRIRMFRIPMPRLGGVGRYVQIYDRGTGDDRELFRVSSEVNYTFEADGKKLLILNPPARFVKISSHGSLKDADNGDQVGKYTIYASNAFLRALDRNAVT